MVAALAAVALLAILPAASAHAALGVIGEFGETGSGDGQFSAPAGVDIDAASGDVYVVDFGNKRVQRFDAQGDFVSAFGGPGTGDGEFEAPGAIAVDQSDGSVYVYDDADNPRIQKFDSSGDFVLSFGAGGSGDGEFGQFGPASFAVDAAGNLYTPDPDNGRVQKFDSSGDYLAQFGGGGDLLFPEALALDPGGNVLVRDIDEAAGVGRLQKFDPDGGFLSQIDMSVFGPIPQQRIAVDATTGNLYVEGFAQDFSGLLVEYDATGAPIGDLGGVPTSPGDLAVNGSAGYITDVGSDRVVIFGVLPAPSATTGAAEDETTTGATVNGVVNPNGSDTTYWFEYGKTTAYGSKAPVTPAVAGSGTTDVPVSTLIAGLEPNATYHYRLVAESANGTTQGDDMQFTTDVAPPTVATTAATGVSLTGATLNGTVNPNNANTTYQFQYGTTPALGSVAPAAPANGGSGSGATARSADIAGLAPGTTYHFRIVATNAGGTSEGAILTFTTAPTPTCATDAKLCPPVDSPKNTPPPPPDEKPVPTAKASSGLKITSATVLGRQLRIKGKLAKTGTKKVKVAVKCGKTRLSATAAAKKGKWSVKLRLRGACLEGRAKITVTYPGDGKLRTGTQRRTVSVGGASAAIKET